MSISSLIGSILSRAAKPQPWGKYSDYQKDPLLLRGTGLSGSKSTDYKYDSGKNIAGVLFEDFPNALEGVSSVATFGAEKYKRSSWHTVENGLQRYHDAMVRHMLAKGRGEEIDPESGRPHSWHIAWNALAISELEIRQKKNPESP